VFYHEAESILHSYVRLFENSIIVSKIARYENLLPYPKMTIVLAYKVYMCFVGVFRNLKKEEVNALFDLLNKMDSFIESDEADHLNLLDQRIRSKEEVSKKELRYFSDYLLDTSTFYSEHDNVIDVFRQVQEFVYNWVVTENRKLDDHIFYEHLYQEFIGIPYIDEYGVEFYELGMPVFDNAKKY